MNWYTYNDDGPYDDWIDTWLTPQLKDLYDITLIRHPLKDTVDAVNLVIHQIESGFGYNNGSVDLIWINGENFATMKNGGYAYGPWSTKAPNAVNYNFENAAIKYDFGLEVNGYEMPYNEAQVIFIRNTKYVNESSIQSINLLLNWIKNEGTGKFTYAAPCSDCSGGTINNYDFTGSVFIRHIWYSLASYSTFVGDFSETVYTKYAPSFYQKLRELEPYLYHNTTYQNSHYPTSNEEVDNAFGRGEVYVTLAYDPGHASSMIADGKWPSTAYGYVLTSGTIANTNYVLIPANAKNKLAAMVTGDFIASCTAVFSRAQPDGIGALGAYDNTTENFVAGIHDFICTRVE